MGNVQQAEKIHETFYTHDNGGRPLKVDIGQNNVFVNTFKEEFDDTVLTPEEKENAYELRFTFTPQKVWVGKSPLNEMTSFSGGHGSDFDGNSILLLDRDGKYVFLGDTVYTFDSYAPIVSYISPVGNSDVPYPYAIDSNGNYYLMIDNAVIHPERKVEDPYDYYYDKRKLVYSDRKKTKRSYKGITKFFCGEDDITMTVSMNPEKEYDRLQESFGDLIIVQNGVKKPLSKQEYVELMNEAQEKLNFKPFLNKNVLYKP